MAQWNKVSQDYLNQERSLFEVYMRADRHGNIYDDLGQGFSGDLFGRLKVSNTYTLFDSTHRYSQDGDFDDVVLGAGSTVGIITYQSTATLGIGTTAGCSIVRETKRVFPYQPGKSLQVFQSFVLSPGKENLIQRVGYGSSENGIFLELNGSQLNIIKRTAISGVGTTITVPQSQWNRDTLDGTGFSTSNPSGIRLDITKAQLLFTEYEWLGVGCVKVGFVNSNGKFHTAHVFNHANVLDSVYMTTASLPCRYEIFNSGITTSSSTMKQICVSIQSNGGYDKLVRRDFARRTTLKTGIAATTFTPLVSIRLKPGREDAVVLPRGVKSVADSNAGVVYELALIRNATLSNVGPLVWEDTTSENVQQNTDATTMSGGTIVFNEFSTAANKIGGGLDIEALYNWDLQLGRTQSKVSDIYTVAIRSISGTLDATASIDFFDLT